MFGSPLIQLEETDSTNHYALELLKLRNIDEGTVIIADFQTEGQGQSGNSWYSEKGKNILMSLVIHPLFLLPKDIFLLNQFTSLAVIHFLNELAQDVSFKIKWPNDIMAEGKKLGGILISNTFRMEKIDSSTIGIGLNINGSHFPSDIPEAVSLKNLTGQEFDLNKCLNNLLLNLENCYRELTNSGYDGIRKEYNSMLYLLDEDSEFEEPSGLGFSGTIKSVSDDGRLCVLAGNQKKYFGFKEIIFKKTKQSL